MSSALFAISLPFALLNAQEVEELEAIEVTGSLIPMHETALDAKAIPVLRLERSDIEKFGYANTSEFLRNLSVNNGGGVSVANNAVGFTPGAASVSLRGLGPDATLILVNGQRVASYPRGSDGSTAFVDLNSIPMEAIESIEVLKDGASATYGADAIAGVVNITLRNDFDGAEAYVRYGNTTDKDASEFNTSILYGTDIGRLTLTIGANYYERNAIFNRDREYSALPPFVSANARPVNADVSLEAIEEAYINAGLTPPAELSDPDFDFFDDGFSYVSQTFLDFINGDFIDGVPLDQVTGTETIDQYIISDISGDGFQPNYYNFNLTSGSLPEIERSGAFATFDYQIWENQPAFIYGDLYYQNVETISELAPAATGIFDNPLGTPLVIPARTATPLTGRLDGVPAGAFNPWNLFDEDISGFSQMRIYEAGNRIFKDTTDAYVFTLGAKFQELADSTWSLDIGGRYSRIDTETESSQVVASRFNEILNQNDPIFQAGGIYEGQAAFNPFNSYLVDIPNNFDLITHAQTTIRDERKSDLIVAYATLANPELFTLESGSVGFAIGLEYREESIEEKPDPLGFTGDIIGQSTDTFTDASRETHSAFIELDVPLVSPEMSILGIHNLGIQLAARHESFKTEDDSVNVGKAALRYAPTEDITFRASWSEGYRQASLFELYADGRISALENIFDPLLDFANPETEVTIAANRDLEAEQSTTRSIGFVFTPTFLSGFSMSLDYWDIERSGKVIANLQDVVNRDFNGEVLAVGESVLRDDFDEIFLVEGAFQNLGETRTNGLDIAFAYAFATDHYGFFEFGGEATYTHAFKIRSSGTDTFEDFIGKPTDAPFVDVGEAPDAYLKWNGYLYSQYNYKNFGLRLTANYTDGFQYTRTDPISFDNVDDEIESTWMYDLQASYALMPDSKTWYGSLDITIGVNNVTDETPPTFNSLMFSGEGYPGFLYSPEGRFYYISLSKKL